MSPIPSLHERIYALVSQIPAGKVATYGQIARLAGGCSARMVGYAMAGLPDNSPVPWQRVINAKGRISPRGVGPGSLIQEQLLGEEGVQFDSTGRIDLVQFGWLGPVSR
jgi:methylated-DNA-protein-cysteine methyltransferase related protein